MSKRSELLREIHLENPQNGFYQIDRDLYQVAEAVSASSLRLASQSLADYLHHQSRPQSLNRGQNLGGAFHLKLLEPQEFGKRVFLAPEESKVSNKGKIAWIEFYLRKVRVILKNEVVDFGEMKADELRLHLKEMEKIAQKEGKIILSNEEFQTLEKMTQSAMNHPLIKGLLKGGQRELSVFWKDPKGQFTLKCRPDYLDLENLRVIDIKTTRDPSPRGFSREILNYRYHVTAALLIDGVGSVSRSNKQEFYFMAVGNQEPYITEIYRLSPEAINEGRLQYQKALEKLSQFFKHYDIYPGYTDGGVCELTLPDWALSPGEQQEAP
ncbi:MAG: PD-(D/E)XK nuclease-like domain-containing protein [Deltaproteobacteria bacterium]|nr:PD-(D/E)XK nuclease-like domain-containing protein [Deltaproteobacteria bacterium]